MNNLVNIIYNLIIIYNLVSDAYSYGWYEPPYMTNFPGTGLNDGRRVSFFDEGNFIKDWLSGGTLNVDLIFPGGQEYDGALVVGFRRFW